MNPSPVVLWLVTDSALYYPCGGTQDWRILTPDEEQARAAFAEVDEDMMFLVAISADGSYETVGRRYRPGHDDD